MGSFDLGQFHPGLRVASLVAWMGTTSSLALVQPYAHAALSSEEVATIAQSITVQIVTPGASGSGILIHQQGDQYFILTAYHVLKSVGSDEEAYAQTADGQEHKLNIQGIRRLEGVDLAVIPFKSSTPYRLADIDRSATAGIGSLVYVAGFPVTQTIQGSFTFRKGELNANASKPNADGYALVYSNDTLPGMSGGPVLNAVGKLIGVHGQADIDSIQLKTTENQTVYVKTGFNLGIPIDTFVRQAPAELKLAVQPPAPPSLKTPVASDFFIPAVENEKSGNYAAALQDLDQAIALDPSYADAYSLRAVVKSRLGDDAGYRTDMEKANRLFLAAGRTADALRSQANLLSAKGDLQGALERYTQTLELNPEDFRAYNNRGVTRAALDDPEGAIADYTQAIRLNPDDALPYFNRGNTHYGQGTLTQAIADYTQAIQLNPTYGDVYTNRGTAYAVQADYEKAIADYTQAIQLNPNDAVIYNNRGNTRYEMGNKDGAIADYTQALRLKLDYALAYHNRGLVHAELGDAPTAIDDYTQAIRINPEYGDAYLGRALVYRRQGDTKAAIRDLERAATLWKEQGNTSNYDLVQEKLQQWREQP